MDISKALADIKSFLLEAGVLALQTQKSITVSYKDANQAVTETDLAISKMAQEKLRHWFELPGHILLDEESIAGVGTPAEVFAQSTYQWALDPIDGTAGYALGRNLWGISLGVMEQGKPLAGIIYLPAIGEMLIADLNTAWRIEKINTPHEVMTVLKAKEMTLNSQIFVESYFGKHMDWGCGWYDKIWINRPESAVQGFFSALVGQAAGSTVITGYSVWDVAAAAAIAARAGFQIRSLEEERNLEAFSAADFQDNWKMKNNWLLSAEQNFSALKDAITGS